MKPFSGVRVKYAAHINPEQKCVPGIKSLGKYCGSYF